MPTRAENLSPHPQGGRVRDVHRSRESVIDQRGQNKSALTHNDFSLSRGEVSRFHRVVQEEIWNLYRGEIRLWILDPETEDLRPITLSAEENRFCAVIPPGHWQAAEVLGDEMLAGCSVAPGFDFSDFE